MNPFYKAYVRGFQWVFGLCARLLPWRKPKRLEGQGSIRQIPELLRGVGVTKTLVVTDPGLVRAGVAGRVLDVLDAAELSYALYDKVEPNPHIDTVESIRSLYLAEGCGGIVAIGGGSAMDAAKGAAARIVRPRRSIPQMKGLLKVLHRIPPFVAVPTTSGTGSETTIAAVITDGHHKYALMDLSLIPRWAVLDPDLALGLPPHITSTTGMDALTHAVEAYLCWTYNTRESIRFAEEATVIIFRYLERAYRDGSDVEARSQMMKAAFLAGFAFTRAGVGNVHAIAHTLGGLYGTPHGLANAVILPIVLEDYGKKVYPKLARLCDLTELPNDGTVAGKAQAFLREVYAMNTRMQIPRTLPVIEEKDIPQMITWALAEANPVYPVPVLYDRARMGRVIDRVRQKTEETALRITDQCKGCTACQKVCPADAIAGERGQQHSIDPRRCVACEVCGRICPFGAVERANGTTVASVKRKLWKHPVIDREKCTACRMCAAICTAGALDVERPQFPGDFRVAVTLAFPDKCVGCALCEQECPVCAITMEEPTVEEHA